MPALSRRTFLQSTAISSAAVTFGGMVPLPLMAGARLSTSDRILVIVELAGGNDGLNTVIPVGHEEYRRKRPKLALAESSVLNIADGLGFHPALRGFADLLEAGKLAVIQGVGYPDPNLSHFESMDIWHTCQRKQDVRLDGWIGRMLEKSASSEKGGDPAALHLGPEKQPFALMSRQVRVPSIRSLDQFQLNGAEDEQFRKAVQELSEARREQSNDLLNFVQTSTSSAIAASERLGSAKKSRQSSVTYPANHLGEQLQTVAQLIGSGLSTSVYYLQLHGFDTHSQQPDVHQALLRQLGDSVRAFLEDVEAAGFGDRVALMAFSEFGRRVEENASDGTDHGTAGPMFVAGAGVRSGLIGKHPDLKDLVNGDLRHHTDFRQVYAALLTHWFQCDAASVLLGNYDPVPVFAS